MADKTAMVAARIDLDLRDRLEEAARAGDRTVSGEIRRALKLYLGDLPRPKVA
jgi:hypothetical protein